MIKCPIEYPYFCPSWTEFGKTSGGAQCVKEQNACFVKREAYNLMRDYDPLSKQCIQDIILASEDSQECDDTFSLRGNGLEKWVKNNSLGMEKRDIPLEVIAELYTREYALEFSVNCEIDIANWQIISTEGDGSCLLHAFLLHLSSTYRKLSSGQGNDRRKIGILFRRYIIQLIRNNQLPSIFKTFLGEFVRVDEKKYGIEGYFRDLVAFLLAPIFGVNVVIIQKPFSQINKDGERVEGPTQILSINSFNVELPTLFFHQSGNHFEMINNPNLAIGEIDRELNLKIKKCIGTEDEVTRQMSGEQTGKFIQDVSTSILGEDIEQKVRDQRDYVRDLTTRMSVELPIFFQDSPLNIQTARTPLISSFLENLTLLNEYEDRLIKLDTLYTLDTPIIKEERKKVKYDEWDLLYNSLNGSYPNLKEKIDFLNNVAIELAFKLKVAKQEEQEEIRNTIKRALSSKKLIEQKYASRAGLKSKRKQQNTTRISQKKM